MKRCGDGEEGDQMESVNVANVLVLLSRGSSGGEEIIDISSRQSPVRVFACKTCNRQFPSFQALGGHRASHKKPRLAADRQGQVHTELAKPRVHECSVCGLEFAIGQALGGHMRRHRAAAPQALTGKKPEDKRTLWLDLNMPPSEGDGDYRKKIFGFELADTTPSMVLDCFH
ncbi:unnamed protein product [Musa acuminata subsp. malaccensis]|uniref:(wild Malaysian banana) hypothetical protein n=1 Tax=Musa acuminata subsp. malaccensis TaxID=214687 RepID=A0A804JAG2_MUSAM|nr:PREDICTED: zinc finger protein ZAT12-like [Musa acuminata subsp. malaccensis]CAG1840627.1 unnamed protein product [Musa acuminata subsp. malaccensis]